MNDDIETLLRGAGRTQPPSGIDVSRAIHQGRTVRRRRRLTAAAAAAVALASGATFALGGLPVDRPTPGSTAVAGADPVQTQLDRNYMMALISGTVQRSGGCLVLERDDGGRTVVVWPPGTRWSADDSVVVLADGLRVGLGDEVEGSGGFVPAGRQGLNRSLGADSADRAIRCAKSLGQRSVALIANVRKR